MKKKLWLLLSSFGIMFAIFSWMQESNLIAGVDILKWQKGIYSLLAGVILYYFIANRVD